MSRNSVVLPTPLGSVHERERESRKTEAEGDERWIVTEYIESGEDK